MTGIEHPRGAGPGATNRALPFVAAAITFTAFLPFARIGVDLHHDGLMLKPALDVLSGQALFRDSFNQYGALSTWLQAGAMAVFGRSLFSLRLLNVLCYAVAAGVLVAVWRRLLPNPLVVLSFALWLALAPFLSFPFWTMIPWSSVIALAFQAVSTLFLCRAVEDRARIGRECAWSGVCAALAAWARTPVGVTHTAAALGALLVLAWWTRDGRFARAGLVGFVAGAAAVTGAFGMVLLSQGSLTDWYLQTIDWPRRWAGARPTDARSIVDTLLPIRALLPRITLAAPAPIVPMLVVSVAVLAWVAWRGGPERRFLLGLAASVTVAVLAVLALDKRILTTAVGVATLVPLGVVGSLLWVGVARLRRSAASLDDRSAMVVVLGLISLASWHQYYPMPCPRHLFWAASPGIGLATYALWRALGDRVAAAWIALGLVAVPLVTADAHEANFTLSQRLVPIEGVPILAGMRTTPNQAAELMQVHTVIRDYEAARAAATAILVDGEDALWAAFAGDLRNPGPLYVNWGPLRGGGLSRQKSRREAFIRELQPLVVVAGGRDRRPSEVERRYGYTPLVAAYDSRTVVLRPPVRPPQSR